MTLRLTEQPSKYRHLEKKSVDELVTLINQEDQTVPLAIQKVLPDLARLIEAIEEKLRNGGRMFYCGCGTGGHLAVDDVLELPNTYGIDPEMIQCVLAGGVENLVLDLEEKEDDTEEGWQTLESKHISQKDIVVGISASGTTPYVLATLKKCKENGITTGSFVNNPDAPISKYSDYPVEVITGPEFVTGSTRKVLLAYLILVFAGFARSKSNTTNLNHCKSEFSSAVLRVYGRHRCCAEVICPACQRQQRHQKQ